MAGEELTLLENNAANATLATDPHFFAPVLPGYLKTVLRDEAKSNAIIAERLKEIGDRCAGVSCARKGETKT